MPDGMRVDHAIAEVSVGVSLYGTLPILKTHRGDTMRVQMVHLLYRSEGAAPWITGWTVQGYDRDTGHALLDETAQWVPRKDWPGWLVDIVASHRPRTGDRMTLPEF